MNQYPSLLVQVPDADEVGVGIVVEGAFSVGEGDGKRAGAGSEHEVEATPKVRPS